jgi:hypothetical protein
MIAASIVFITGLVTTLAGVGGLENNADMTSVVIVTVLGCAITAVGAHMVKRANNG